MVRNGDAELDNGGGPLRLRDGERARLGAGDQYAELQQLWDAGLRSTPGASIASAAISDDESTRYVSRDVVGYEDLDNYGNWYSEPGYGAVWAPTIVIAGWAPYHFGSWSWISPWGWTWIDQSPWGFAPFHYGRWAYLHHRWCWVPPRILRIRCGDRASSPGITTLDRVAPHQKPVSWVPLGPSEVYVPSKSASPRYLRNVNVSNTAIANNAYITNVYNNRVRDIRYVNRNVPGAVTTLPRAAFVAPRTPVWTGDFRDNQRLLPGSSAQPPVALAPNNPDRQADDRRMTVPRRPTDRRQVESEGNWVRIDTGTRFDSRVNSFTPSGEQPAAITQPTPLATLRPAQMPAMTRSTPPPVRYTPTPSRDNRMRVQGTPHQNEVSVESRSAHESAAPAATRTAPAPGQSGRAVAPVRDASSARTATQSRPAPARTPSNRSGLIANQP